MIQIVSMIMTSATNCINTRQRMSFCEVCGEPPRAKLIKPKQQDDRDDEERERHQGIDEDIRHPRTNTTASAAKPCAAGRNRVTLS